MATPTNEIRQPLLSPELSVVREMLGNIETLTAAGQRHTMAKVVGFIGQQATSCSQKLTPHNRSMLGQLLGQLTRESERLSPDARSFGGHAEALVGLLASVRA